MLFITQLLLCILCIGIIIFEVYLIAKRNRKIIVKGKDDFFTVTLIMFFLILIMPLDQSASVLVALRNTLAIVSVFATLAIKRGVSERGIEKIFYFIPWNNIIKVKINSYQSVKVMVYFELYSNKTAKLIFHYRHLSALLFQLQKYLQRDAILLEEKVEQDMKKFLRA